MPEPLTSDQHAELASQLTALAAELTDHLVRSRDRAGAVELDQSSVGRVSRIDAIQQQQMAVAERRRMEIRLERVKVALEAVDEGEYGECRECGEDVGFRRLQARPETPFCVPCAEAKGH